MNNSAKLTDILEQIINYTSIDPKLKPSLIPGLSLAEISEKLSNFPFCLPKEVEELYEWHNGMVIDTDSQLFYYHTFLPLQKSLKIREEWLTYNTNNDLIIYSPDLLPLFEFAGEYYAVQCTNEKQDSGLIWFVYHDSSAVYNSLKNMLLAILQCYQTDAYQAFFTENFLETNVDEKKVAKIKLAHNPIRQELFDLLRARQDFYAHP